MCLCRAYIDEEEMMEGTTGALIYNKAAQADERTYTLVPVNPAVVTTR